MKRVFTVLLLFVSCVCACAQNFQFAGAYNVGIDAEGYSLGIGDVNGDGILDMALAEEFGGPSGEGGIAVLLGNPDGTFQSAYYISTEPEPVDLVLADFNHDGRLDILTDSFLGSYTNIYVQLGNGDGTFQAPASFPGIGIVPLVADFNNDGNLDVMLESFVYPSDTDISLLLGNGDGTFQPAITTVVHNAAAVGGVLADLNHDGKMDAAFGSAGKITILLGRGDGTFDVSFDRRPKGIRTGFVALAAADFNVDGNIDLAATDDISETIRVFPGNGDGTFQPPLEPHPLIYPVGVVAADFDGDGNPDVAVLDRYPDGGVSVLLGNGHGGLGPAYRVGQHLNVANVLSADVNGDGRPDLILYTLGNIIVFKNASGQ